MSSSLVLRSGAFHIVFIDGIWNSDTSFFIMVHWHISRISYRFAVIRRFILFGSCPFPPILGVFRVKHPHISQQHMSYPKQVFLTPNRVFWAIVRENRFTGMGCWRINNSHTWRLDYSSDPYQINISSIIIVICSRCCESHPFLLKENMNCL